MNFESLTRSSLLLYSRPAHSIFHEGAKLPGWDLVTFEIFFKGQLVRACSSLQNLARFHARCPHTGYIWLLLSLAFWPHLHTAPPGSTPSSTFSGVTPSLCLPSILGFHILRFSAQGACISPYFLQRGCITGWIMLPPPTNMSKSQPPEPENVTLFENRILADVIENI